MNKSQELAVMILRSEIRAEELLKQHQDAWYGQEPEIIEVKKEEESWPTTREE